MVKRVFIRILAFSLVWWTLLEGEFQVWPFGVPTILAATVSSLLVFPTGVRFRPLGLLRFVPYFLVQSVLGGIDVARRALSPKLPISPGFIDVPLALEDEAARVCFVWTVSLLPGTAGAELLEEKLRVHVLDTALPIEERLVELERRVARRTNELQEANELMALEIGERRRMEDELRRVQERYRRLVENMPGVAYVWEVHPDAEPRSFAYVSPRIQDVLGFSPDGWHASDRIHPHDQARVREAIDRSARTGHPFLMEYRFLAKDGSVVWVLDHASLISRTERGDPSSFQGVMLDITARKDAESHAEAAEDRFRTLAERGPVIVFSFGLTYADGAQPTVNVDYISPQAAELVRYPLEYWLRESEGWLDMVHPDDRDRVAQGMQRSWRTGEPWSTRYRMIRSDGTLIGILDTGRMLERDPLGRPSRFLGVMLDTTDDEEARARLELSERSQRQALEGALAIPWSETIHPRTGFEHYTYIGPQAFDILGYTPEELMVERGHFHRIVHPDDRTRVGKTLSGSARSGVWEDTYRILRRDGDIRWLHSFGRRVSPPGAIPEVWHGIAVDVTASRVEPETRPGRRTEAQEDERAERSSVEDPTVR
jgi:multicomponent Na+:H+ antiporter subunit E